MNRERLKKNIVDQIKEAQIKLGYERETVRLYYPADSLKGLVDRKSRKETGRLLSPEEEREENTALLKEIREEFKEPDPELGQLHFALHGGRFEINVSPEGAQYVHEKVKTPAFLQDIITLFQDPHHCSMEQVCRIFEKYSPDYVREQMPEGTEFDCVMYFSDSSVDEYFYCIRQEMGHMIYHRFTREDYYRLRSEEGSEEGE